MPIGTRAIGVMPGPVWILFAGAWALRAGFVAYHASIGWQLRYDPGYYLTLAANMRHGVYSLFHPLDIPDTTHMPGYPFLLFLLRGDVLSVLLLQALASALKVPLVHAIGLRIGLAQRWALAAAGLMAVEPLDILFAGQVLTESLFTTMLTVGAWALVGPSSWWRASLLAACIAACAWLRPNGALLLMAVPVLASWLIRWPWQRAFAAFALAAALVFPWVLRQHHLAGRWALGDGGVVAVAHFHLPGVLQRAGDARASTYREGLRARAAATDWEDRISSNAYFATLRGDIRGALADHPVAWMIEQGAKSARILVAPGRGHFNAFFAGHPAARWGLLGLSAFFASAVILALGACVLAWRVMPRALVVLVIIALLLMLTGGLSVADARFKVPAMPLLILALAWTARWLSARRRQVRRAPG